MAFNLLGGDGALSFMFPATGTNNLWIIVIAVVWVILLMAIMGIAFYFIHPIMLYPYVCPIQGMRNGVLKFLGKAYAKEVTDRESGVVRMRIWRFMKKAVFIEPVPNEFKMAYTAKKDMILLFEDNGGKLRPLQIVLNPKTQKEILQPNDKDVDFWMINELNSAVKAYTKQPAWMMYLPLIFSATFVVFIFVFILILTKQMGELVNKLGELIGALTAAFPK